MRRRTECSNHAGVIVLNIENINCYLFFLLMEAAFKIHLAQKSEGARASSLLNGHDASGPAAGGMRTAGATRAINCNVCNLRGLRQLNRETGRTTVHPCNARPQVTVVE